MELNFNILRELYLKKDNRNILSEFLKYMSRTKRIYMTSAFGKNINILCANCFNCVITNEKSIDINMFCKICLRSHFNKYTRFDLSGGKIDPGDSEDSDCKYNYHFAVSFHHECDLYKREKTQALFITERYLKGHIPDIKSEPFAIFSLFNDKIEEVSNCQHLL